MGFRPVGIYRQVGWKLGSWYDVGWWQLTLDGSVEQPHEVRPLSALDPMLVDSLLQP
jgi:hypothetical protein